MSILVDTGVLAGAWLPRDPHHRAAERGLRLATAGTWGRAVVTDYLVDEAVTLVRTRSRNHAHADRFAACLLSEPPFPPAFQLVHIGPPLFAQARDLFRKYADKPLSFTDCATIAVAQVLGLDGVLAFDRGFDGIIRRFDPLDEGSLAAAP